MNIEFFIKYFLLNSRDTYHTVETLKMYVFHSYYAISKLKLLRVNNINVLYVIQVNIKNKMKNFHIYIF